MKYFGTDGFRGVAGTDLTVEHAYKIGRFIGWYYGARQGRKARIVVGKDTRRSWRRALQHWAVAGVVPKQGLGGAVYSYGVVCMGLLHRL